MREFLGGVSDFLETRRIENLNELERHAKPEAEQTVVAELAAKKEAAQQEYQAGVLAAPSPSDDYMELTREFLELKRDLDAKTDEWAELSESLEV